MLKVVSSETALEIIKEKFSFLRTEKEEISVFDCVGRILSDDIVSHEDIPAFDRSTVDGFAVKSSDTFGCSEAIPSQLTVVGEVFMGEEAAMEIHEGECVRISTGGMLPKGADSVVMVEYTDTSFDGLCLIFKAVSPFENVTKKGDDICHSQKVISAGQKITSREVGILSALGHMKVCVSKKPKVGIISTGDEIVSADSEVPMGKIRDINSHILSAVCCEFGCDRTEYGIIKDDYGSIHETLEKAVKENDIVLISGGSSAGARDMTAKIISDSGELFFHGIAMKPGKPTILGQIDGKPVFGLPGHPAAAYCVAMRFVKFLTEMMTGEVGKRSFTKGRLTQNISSNHGREEMIFVRLDGDRVTPMFAKSGIISLLSRADGYIIIDRDSEGMKNGDEVTVECF